MTNQINIAVVGVGRWGTHLLRNFLEHPQAKVVAVVDPNPEHLATVKRHYISINSIDDEILFTHEWPAIKQLANIDAVVIATPASTHYSLATDALDWGYHVLAEKPLTLDPRECWELCQLAEKQQRQLMVDHTYLFHPAIERGQAVVEGGELGDLRYGYACRTHLGPVRQDVDVLWDLAIHDVAIFNTWLGQKPVSVQALGRVWLQGENPRWGEPQVERKPYPVTPSSLSDLVWVTLTYSNGFQAYIHLCWLNPDKQRRLAVVGSRGCLIFDEMSAKSPLTLMQGELEVQGNKFMPVNQRRQVLQVETGEPLKRVCDRFVRCVHSNTPCMISSGWVGTELVEILAALTESLNQGGKLVFLDKNQ